MSKKSFDTQAATSKFFTHQTQEKHDTQDKSEIQEPAAAADLTREDLVNIVRESMEIAKQITPQRGRPKKAEEEKLRGYRYNLNLDRDLQQYLKEIAWKKRTSITQYINDLIRADMAAYFQECEAKGIDPKEGWETDEP